jgi:hypothetical protein
LAGLTARLLFLGGGFFEDPAGEAFDLSRSAVIGGRARSEGAAIAIRVLEAADELPDDRRLPLLHGLTVKEPSLGRYGSHRGCISAS